MKIANNSRTIAVGKTGSGKSYLARHILKGISRLVVFDTKGNLKDNFGLEDYNKNSIKKLMSKEPVRIQIKQPIMDEKDLMEYFDTAYFKMLFECGNLYIYFDEIFSITRGSNTLTPYLNAIYTQGREVANIGVFGCVQRPSRIPLFMLSENEHYFIFRLNLYADRKKMAEIVGDEAKELPRDPYGFYYYNTDLEKPKYYARLKT